MITTECKRGDQFILDITRTDHAGDPVDLTGQAISALSLIHI